MGNSEHSGAERRANTDGRHVDAPEPARADGGANIKTLQRHVADRVNSAFGGPAGQLYGGPARPTVTITDQRIDRAKAYPYSSIVGTGVLLHNAGGAVIGQLSLLNVSGGKEEAVAMARQVEGLLRYGLVKRAELAAELEREAAIAAPISNEERAVAEAKRRHEALAAPLGTGFYPLLKPLDALAAAGVAGLFLILCMLVAALV